MKVGDYVRNENGLIGKIIGFKGDMVETDNKRLITYKSEHSECKIKKRPIDLIEVGDYVNGLPVMKIEINEDGERNIYVGEENTTFGWLVYYDIKSIVTKEQFEQMEYRIGE